MYLFCAHRGLDLNTISDVPLPLLRHIIRHWFKMPCVAFDLRGLVSTHLCKLQASTICLSCHSGLSVPYNSPGKKPINKKSFLLEIDEARVTGFVIKHFGLIWGARLERWSEHVWPLCRPLRRWDAFNGATGKTGLIYKTSRASPQTVALVQWQMAETITALTALWSAGEQVVLDSFPPPPIKMAERLWLCEAFHWVKCGRGSKSRKELLTVRPVWLF